VVRASSAVTPHAAIRTRDGVRALVIVAAIVVAYGLGIGAIERAIHARPTFAVDPAQPLVMIGETFFELDPRTQAAFGATVLAEAALLYALWHVASRGVSVLRIAAPIGAVCMFAISLATDFSNTDPYLYVSYGKEPSLAATYRNDPARRPLPAGFAGPRVTYGPDGPSPYGPLLQEFDRVLVGPTRSMVDALRAVRLASAAALAATFLVVLALRLPAPASAAVVLNPAFYYAYVVQAHNDVYPILALVGGVALARARSPLLAAVCGAIAGASKISMLFVALAAFGTIAAFRTRVAVTAGIVTGAAILSWSLGGEAYVHALRQVASWQSGLQVGVLPHGIRLVVQGAAFAGTLAAAAAALAGQRAFRAATLIFPGASGMAQSWYFAWGLPYALSGEGPMRAFCTFLPIVAYLTDPALADPKSLHFTTLVVAIIAIALAYEIVRRSPPTAK
jgi:hypothetical protein